MNEKGIKSPEYFQRRKLADWKPDISKKYLWVQTAVIFDSEDHGETLEHGEYEVAEYYR